MVPKGGRLTLVIAILLVAVIPTAYGSPVDPSWIPGYWDDDDFDNSVLLITDACAIDVAAADCGIALVVVARVEYATPRDRSTDAISTLHSRAPPRRWSPAVA